MTYIGQLSLCLQRGSQQAPRLLHGSAGSKVCVVVSSKEFTPSSSGLAFLFSASDSMDLLFPCDVERL